MSIPGYEDLIDSILTDLDIIDPIKSELERFFSKVNLKTKYELVSSKDIVELRQKLKLADDKLKTAFDELKVAIKDKRVIDRIDNLKKELGRLQGLIFLRKITKDCDHVIRNIANAYTNKLQVVNKVLAQNLNHDFEITYKCFDMILEDTMLEICLGLYGEIDKSSNHDNIKNQALVYLFHDLINHSD